jgi:hypothetical protein
MLRAAVYMQPSVVHEHTMNHCCPTHSLPHPLAHSSVTTTGPSSHVSMSTNSTPSSSSVVGAGGGTIPTKRSARGITPHTGHTCMRDKSTQILIGTKWSRDKLNCKACFGVTRNCTRTRTAGRTRQASRSCRHRVNAIAEHLRLLLHRTRRVACAPFDASDAPCTCYIWTRRTDGGCSEPRRERVDVNLCAPSRHTRVGSTEAPTVTLARTRDIGEVLYRVPLSLQQLHDSGADLGDIRR